MRTHVLVVALAAVLLVIPAVQAEEHAGAAGDVERGMERGAAATERGLRTAGAATGRAIGTAMDKTGEGIGWVIDRTGRGLEKAGRALAGD